MPISVDDIPQLVAAMSLEEKASLLSGSDFWHTQAIERLGIPAMMVTDGPHGLRKQAGASDHVGLADSIPATCFPSAAGLASTWDRDLLFAVGRALGVETRANSVGVLLGPGINIKRSPLCGRNFEYFSEDPFLSGELAAPLVSGVQSQGVGTSLKHFAANNQETDRMRVSAQIDPRTLREIYLSAFEKVVKTASPWTIMCAYNKINGVYASEDPWLLTDLLRGEWGYDGVVVSDWGAVDDRVRALRAGLDLEMPSSAGINDDKIVRAVRSGELDEVTVDLAVTRLLTLLAKAGTALAHPGEADYEAHHRLAEDIAAKAAVLLKNDGILPLKDFSEAVIIGEMARTPRYQGAGSSQVNPTRLISALDALQERGIEVPFEPGYKLAQAAGKPGQDQSEVALRDQAVLAAREKTAVLFLGLPAESESEGFDRQTISLPSAQLELLRDVSTVARDVVVLLSNGSVVDVGWQDQADAILELWLGGQAGGAAAIDLLIGDASPSGRLAESIPLKLGNLPAQLNFPGSGGVVRYGEGLFVGYRGLDKMETDVAYPFGHGLTYTRFELGDMRVLLAPLSEETGDDDIVGQVTARITNVGRRRGTAVPQLYVGRPESQLERPVRELRGFVSLPLHPGQSEYFTFTLTKRDISHWDTAREKWAVESGPIEFWVGESSRDLSLHQMDTVVAPPLTPPLTAESTIAEWLSSPVAGQAFLDALGDFGATFSGQGSGFSGKDGGMAALLGGTPIAKIPVMGFSAGFTEKTLRQLLAEYGADT